MNLPRISTAFYKHSYKILNLLPHFPFKILKSSQSAITSRINNVVMPRFFAFANFVKAPSFKLWNWQEVNNKISSLGKKGQFLGVPFTFISLNEIASLIFRKDSPLSLLEKYEYEKLKPIFNVIEQYPLPGEDTSVLEESSQADNTQNSEILVDPSTKKYSDFLVEIRSILEKEPFLNDLIQALDFSKSSKDDIKNQKNIASNIYIVSLLDFKIISSAHSIFIELMKENPETALAHTYQICKENPDLLKYLKAIAYFEKLTKKCAKGKVLKSEENRSNKFS